MFDFQNLPKKYILAVLAVLTAVLVVITVFQPAPYVFKDQTDYDARIKTAEADRLAYEEYLKNVKPDPAASKQFYENIIDTKTVEKEVNTILDTSQQPRPVVIDSKYLRISQNTSQEAVSGYFQKLAKSVLTMPAELRGVNTALFTDTQSQPALSEALRKTSGLIELLYQTEVPQPLLGFHSAELAALSEYQRLLQTSLNYAGDLTQDPWRTMYGSHVTLNDRVAAAEKEVNEIGKTYNLQLALAPLPGEENVTIFEKFGIIKSAHAQFGIPQQVLTILDVPRSIKEALQDALGSAFANFFTTFIDGLVEKIENNYKISSFLYYTDAVATGQYLDEYLTKYVRDPLDQNLMRRLLPQVSCSDNKDQFKTIFQAKAREVFNPNTLDPRSTDFYSDLSKAGDPLATPLGQEEIFKQYASGALAKSYEAATTELLNESGLKVPRTLTGKAIAATLTTISTSLQQGIKSQFDLGTYNPESLVSKVVAQGVQTFMSKFVFKGVVFKEQNTCIDFPQLDPVTPGTFPQYTQPTFDPNTIRNETLQSGGYAPR